MKTESIEAWGATHADDGQGPTNYNAASPGVAVQMNDVLWTRKQLAEFLGYSEETIRGYESRHPDRIPPRVGALKRSLWLKSEVLKWLQAQTKQTAVPKPPAHPSGALVDELATPMRVPKRGRPRNTPA